VGVLEKDSSELKPTIILLLGCGDESPANLKTPTPRGQARRARTKKIKRRKSGSEWGQRRADAGRGGRLRGDRCLGSERGADLLWRDGSRRGRS
jgi:hypothetical protein